MNLDSTNNKTMTNKTETPDEGNNSSDELQAKIQTALMEELVKLKKATEKKLLTKMQSSSSSATKRMDRCNARHRQTGKLLCQKKSRKNGMCLYHNKKRETEGMTPEQKKVYTEQAKQARRAEIRAREGVAVVFNGNPMQMQPQPMQHAQSAQQFMMPQQQFPVQGQFMPLGFQPMPQQH